MAGIHLKERARQARSSALFQNAPPLPHPERLLPASLPQPSQTQLFTFQYPTSHSFLASFPTSPIPEKTTNLNEQNQHAARKEDEKNLETKLAFITKIFTHHSVPSTSNTIPLSLGALKGFPLSGFRGAKRRRDPGAGLGMLLLSGCSWVVGVCVFGAGVRAGSGGELWRVEENIRSTLFLLI